MQPVPKPSFPPSFLSTPCITSSAPPSGGERPAASVAAGGEPAWHEASEYVNAPWGLFPAPLAPLPPTSTAPSSATAAAARKAVIDNFRLLGRSMAKALQDSRLMDLPLSYVFYRAILGKHLDVTDVARWGSVRTEWSDQSTN